MAKSAWVVDVTDQNFEAELVERSKRVPIIVDFWAPWCGPCRALAPLLEKVVDEHQGKVILAKVNTDENPGLAQQFASEGIPAVYSVKDGAIVNRFVGVLPEEQVRAFIAEVAPTAVDTEAKDAASLETQDAKAAEAMYRDALAADASHEKSKIGLARVLLQGEGREAEAAKILEGFEIGEHVDEAERLRTIIDLRSVPHGDNDLARAKAAALPSDPESQFALGTVMAARGEYVPALDVLLATAEEDKALARTKIRELMVKIFRILGNQTDTSETYRRRLQSLLY